jgi:hypothetical protein
MLIHNQLKEKKLHEKMRSYYQKIIRIYNFIKYLYVFIHIFRYMPQTIIE